MLRTLTCARREKKNLIGSEQFIGHCTSGIRMKRITCMKLTSRVQFVLAQVSHHRCSRNVKNTDLDPLGNGFTKSTVECAHSSWCSADNMKASGVAGTTFPLDKEKKDATCSKLVFAVHKFRGA